MESCGTGLVEPIVPDEGRATAPIAVDKSRRPADTHADTLAAAAARIVARTSARPRDPEPDMPKVRVQNSEGPRRSQLDRACNILNQDVSGRGLARYSAGPFVLAVDYRCWRRTIDESSVHRMRTTFALVPVG